MASQVQKNLSATDPNSAQVAIFLSAPAQGLAQLPVFLSARGAQSICWVEPPCAEYDSVTLIANGIGAYDALHALADLQIDRAFLISQIASEQARLS